MKRLTERLSNGQAAVYGCGNNCKYDYKYCNNHLEDCPTINDIYEKLAVWEDLEEQLEKVYGECDGLLETVINHLLQHEGIDIGEPKKARLLTDEAVDEWEEYKKAKEQGLLLRLPCRLGDIIDRIISHNEIVTLMFETEIGSFRGLQHFWHGMAWNIPKEYLELPFVKIHGVVPDKITEADTIWIEVRKEAEQSLARMEEGNG